MLKLIKRKSMLALKVSGTLQDEDKVLFVSNVMGKSFVVRNANDVYTEKSKTNNLKEEAMLSDIRMAKYKPDSLSRMLSSLCALFQQEYWTYEWCHRSIIFNHLKSTRTIVNSDL